MAEVVRSFRELNVYQESFTLQQELFHLSRSFPRDERYALTDQIRRSSRSIGANMAEAWQKRRYEAHFVSKLSDADGEQAETQHWIETAVACEYLSPGEGRKLIGSCEKIGRMLGKMMSQSDSWCARHKPTA